MAEAKCRARDLRTRVLSRCRIRCVGGVRGSRDVTALQCIMWDLVPILAVLNMRTLYH